MQKISLYTPWRRRLQILIAALIFLIPFIKFGDKSLFKLDLPALTLHLAGSAFRIEELYIFWVLVLCFIFLFILTTIILGRVWCGWLCPQTAFVDLAETATRYLGKKLPPFALRALKHSIYFAAGLIVGANFVWYFLAPDTFFQRLMNGHLGLWPSGTVITICLIIYIDLAFVGRIFCKEFCPYGRFQTILTDKGTLTLQAHPEHIDRCINCQACVNVCPTGIDIRKGFQIECINCAQCIDACTKIMAAKKQPAIIQYTFGIEDRGWRSIFTPKTISVSFVVLGLFVTFFFLTNHRTAAILKIGRSSVIQSKIIAGNQQATFFKGALINRSQKKATLHIKVHNAQGELLKTRGMMTFMLAGGEKKDVSFAVISPAMTSSQSIPIVFGIYNTEGKMLTEHGAFLTGIPQ